MNSRRYLIFYPSSKHQKKHSEIVEWHDWSHKPVQLNDNSVFKVELLNDTKAK